MPYEATFASVPDHLVIVHEDGPVRVSRGLHRSWLSRPVAPGGLFVLPGGLDFAVQLGGHLSSLHLYVRDAVLRAVASDRIAGDPARVELQPRLGEHDPVLDRLCHAAALAASEAGTHSGCLADALAQAIAARLLQAHSNRATRIGGSLAPRSGGLAEGQLARIKDYIAAHLHHPIGLGDLAALSGSTTATLARRFKQSTGESPHRFLIAARIERARFLLERSRLPIAEIALRCGFCHQEHLTREFGRRVGTTPAAYRRQRTS